MLPMSRATLSVAAGTGEGGAGDRAGRSRCPRRLQPTEVTLGCGRCRHPWVLGCPMASLPRWSSLPGVLHPKHPWPSGASRGDNGDTRDSHSPTEPPPLLGSLLPYSWPGLLRSGEPGKRNAVPRPRRARAAQRGGDLPALPPPTCSPLLPGASRGEEPRACGGAAGQGAPRAAAPPGPGWSPQIHGMATAGGRGGGGGTALAGAEQPQDNPRGVGDGGGLSSPISTFTSWLHSSWKRLKTRQEYLPRSAVVTGFTCQQDGAGSWDGELCRPVPRHATPRRATPW